MGRPCQSSVSGGSRRELPERRAKKEWVYRKEKHEGVNKGPEIPPWVAVIVIVLVVVVAVALMWRGTGKKTMSVSEQEKMRQIMKERGFTLQRPQGATVPGGPGMSGQAATSQTPQSAPR